MKTDTQNQKKAPLSARPPVVVVMGHVDHGKTKLLDYIRKTSVVESESGGITQHIGAYEVEYKQRKITFIDTPGHEAFSGLRTRGAHVADVAILVIAADEGLKPQTLEALNVIKKAQLPFMVAFNKMDKPGANIDKIKNDLMQYEVFVEGMGGSVPWVAISAKLGQGIDDLLDTLLLIADLEELTGDPEVPASGVVIESHVDARRGVTATLLITNGKLFINQMVVVGNAYAQVRILENFLGKPINEAGLSASVRVVGFNVAPEVGQQFRTFVDKQEAISYNPDLGQLSEKRPSAVILTSLGEDIKLVVSVVVKADVSGSLEALVGQLKVLQKPPVYLNIIKADIGALSEDDVQLLAPAENRVAIVFRSGVSESAVVSARQLNVTVFEFDVIYAIEKELSAFIQSVAARIMQKVEIGRAQILKVFSVAGGKTLVGCRLEAGEIKLNDSVEIIRPALSSQGGNENFFGTGKIVTLKKGKSDVKQISEGEFGMVIKTSSELTGDDILRVSAQKSLQT